LQSLRWVARLRGNQDCMNALGEGKIKFVVQSHVDKNNAVDPFRYEKAQNWQKLITSKLRHTVK